MMIANSATLTAANMKPAIAPRTRALTPALSHPMGEGEVVPALEENGRGANVHNAADRNVRAPVLGSPRETSKRLAREWRTIETMVRIFCRDHHEGGLCPECKGLLDYASVRLDRCRFGADKPTCAKCPVHCYQKNRREQVKAVMRYAGPRMLWEHPILSLWHWVDARRRPALKI
jgi:hypothetical protein